MASHKDRSLTLVARARDAEAAFKVAIAADENASSSAANHATLTAYRSIPTTPAGIRALIELALEVEETADREVISLLRSILRSPVLAP